MMANIMIANSTNNAIWSNGAIAFNIENRTTWRPEKTKNIFITTFYACGLHCGFSGIAVCTHLEHVKQVSKVAEHEELVRFLSSSLLQLPEIVWWGWCSKTNSNEIAQFRKKLLHKNILRRANNDSVHDIPYVSQIWIRM